MTIESSRQGKAAVVLISGRMDAENAPRFQKECEEHLKAGVTHLVVDVSQLQYVSSMGLGTFLFLAKQSQSKGGGVLLCGMKGFVKEVFDITHVTSLFLQFDTTEAAVQSI